MVDCFCHQCFNQLHRSYADLIPMNRTFFFYFYSVQHVKPCIVRAFFSKCKITGEKSHFDFIVSCFSFHLEYDVYFLLVSRSKNIFLLEIEECNVVSHITAEITNGDRPFFKYVLELANGHPLGLPSDHSLATIFFNSVEYFQQHWANDSGGIRWLWAPG